MPVTRIPILKFRGIEHGCTLVHQSGARGTLLRHRSFEGHAAVTVRRQGHEAEWWLQDCTHARTCPCREGR